MEKYQKKVLIVDMEKKIGQCYSMSSVHKKTKILPSNRWAKAQQLQSCAITDVNYSAFEPNGEAECDSRRRYVLRMLISSLVSLIGKEVPLNALEFTGGTVDGGHMQNAILL